MKFRFLLLITLLIGAVSCTSDDDVKEIILSNEALAGTVWTGRCIDSPAGPYEVTKTILEFRDKNTYYLQGCNFLHKNEQFLAQKNTIRLKWETFVVRKFTKDTLIMESVIFNGAVAYRLELKRER